MICNIFTIISRVVAKAHGIIIRVYVWIENIKFLVCAYIETQVLLWWESWCLEGDVSTNSEPKLLNVRKRGRRTKLDNIISFQTTGELEQTHKQNPKCTPHVCMSGMCEVFVREESSIITVGCVQIKDANTSATANSYRDPF